MQVRIRRGMGFDQAPAVPVESIRDIPAVAVYGNDHAGLRGRLAVVPGEHVVAGQPLFVDRTDPEIPFVSPIDGTVADLRWGSRRRLLSVVIEAAGPCRDEAGLAEPVGGLDEVADLPLTRLRRFLQNTGLWPSIRQRPGDCLAPSAGLADVLLVTAIDTEPRAPRPGCVLEGNWDSFWLGVAALSRFARHATWICAGPGFQPLPPAIAERARLAVFEGPHPAGLPGTHIARLAPLGSGRTAWHVDYQDTAAIGHALASGRVPLTRVVGFSGQPLETSRLLRLPRGADVTGLEHPTGTDLVCGSLLAGRPALAPFEHLGRFHRQVTVVDKPGVGAPGGWPGSESLIRLDPGQARPLAGGMLAHDGLDRRWPLPGPPAPLLRALMTGNLERAVALGCLDLGEEDLALASLSCPGGHDYGAYLREALDRVLEESRR